MKRYVLSILMILSFFVSQAQKVPYVPFRTNGSYMVKDSALAIGQALIPAYSSHSLGAYADLWGQSFGVNKTSKSLNVRGNAEWLVYPDSVAVKQWIAALPTASNLALGTPTSTTYPITNSNGTGFTLPIATTSLSGLLSGSDKTIINGLPTGYVQNQFATAQAVNFRIDGTANIGATAAGTHSLGVTSKADASAAIVARGFSATQSRSIQEWQNSSSSVVASVSPSGIINASQYKLSALNPVPASATSTGTLGEIRITATYIYVCIATNTWVRSPLATW